MDRRSFLKTAAGATALMIMGGCKKRSNGQFTIGQPLIPWQKGQFQVHFINTGLGESMFWILPDGTTMLLDCGELDVEGSGRVPVPVLPSKERHAGEWIARYVERVNPQKQRVDYLMLSHYHADHCGSWDYAKSVDTRLGQPYPLSGIPLAAETLSFHKAIDRAWPTYDDPLPVYRKEEGNVAFFMDNFYKYMIKERGMEVERFRLGETDQISMLQNGGSYPSFHIRNITANGRIAMMDGTIRDLYRERIQEEHLQSVNENGMSLGLEVTYGNFRFVTCGDFSDNWTQEDGTRFEIEDALSEAIRPAHVAKINHHGHFSMPESLIRALRSHVYCSCVWTKRQNVAEVLDRLNDRNLYPGDRIVCPTIFPEARQKEDQGQSFLSILEPNAFDGGHVVLTVEKGGKEYSVAYVDASDEKMIVKSVHPFTTDLL